MANPLGGSDPGSRSSDTVRVPLAEEGRHVSVPSLKLYFEQLGSSISPDRASSSSSSSSARTPSPGVVPKIQQFEQFFGKEEEEVDEPIFISSENKSYSTGNVVTPRVRWIKREEESISRSLGSGISIDTTKVPSFQELQSSFSPRGGSGEYEPPLIRREMRACSSSSSVSSFRPSSSPPVTARFSPRSPRGSLTPRGRVPEGLPGGVLSRGQEKLFNDAWIEELPHSSSKKKRKRFNDSLTKYMQHEVSKAKHPPINFRLIEQELDQLTKHEIDKYLSDSQEELASSPLKPDMAMGSPRSTLAMKLVLSKIQSNGILLKTVIPLFVSMKQALIAYHEKHHKKTPWSLKLSNYLSYLIYHRNNLVEFMKRADEVHDPIIIKLFQTVLKTNQDHLFNFLREWVGPKSHLRLRPNLAEINLDYQDAPKIQQHRHLVTEPEDVLVPFSNINMGQVLQGFTSPGGLQLESFSINGTTIDTVGLVTGGIEAQKRFFYDLLARYYSESGKHANKEELGKEVENLLYGNDVPSKELLWLCTMPWKHFFDKVRLLYPGLQCGMATVPEESHSRLSIAVDTEGNYRITRGITYHCYGVKATPRGVSQQPDVSNPLASIEFYWTVTPFINDSDKSKWSGCIQVPNPIKITPHTGYEIKWKILKSLIDYADSDDQATMVRLPVIEEESEILEFNQQLIETFDCPYSLGTVPAPSAFALEFIVKNFCREMIDENKDKFCARGYGYKVDDKQINQFAQQIWRHLQINGRVLEPLLARLVVFEEKLRRYLLIKTCRTEWSDRLLVILQELILSKKYAEYGIELNKDLRTFLLILEKDIKDDSMRQLILNVMCGRWENLNGRKDMAYQEEHIGLLLGTLHYFLDSHKFLKPVLKEMILEIGRISEEHILSRKYPWIEAEHKKHPISEIDVTQIVRCFMHYTRPIFDEVVINGSPLYISELQGDVSKRQNAYFVRLLTAIYKAYAPSMTQKSIQEQVTYMLHYEKEEESSKLLANEKIPCLDVLRLCANSCWMVADIYMRNLFDINNPPLKSLPHEGISCYIEITDHSSFSVEHRRCYGIYPREVPDNVACNRVNRDQLLARIPFSWKLSPFQDNGRETFIAHLQVKGVNIESGVLAEYRHLIKKALHDYHRSFQKTIGWEDVPKEPVLIRPLAASKGSMIHIQSPKYARRSKPKTPRGGSFSGASSSSSAL